MQNLVIRIKHALVLIQVYFGVITDLWFIYTSYLDMYILLRIWVLKRLQKYM